MGKEGYALRYELSKMTGRTSVPAVFVGGEFVGGCNDGGLGGVMTLESQGKLKGMCRPLVHDQCTMEREPAVLDSRVVARKSIREHLVGLRAVLERLSAPFLLIFCLNIAWPM